MISALAPDRPDQAFSISVLPGRAERRPPVPNAHGSRAAKCSVIVTDEIFGRRVPRECFGDLVRQALRRWVLGHRKPQQLPPSMAKNKKYEHLPKGTRRNDNEINRCNLLQVIAKEIFRVSVILPPFRNLSGPFWCHVFGTLRSAHAA